MHHEVDPNAVENIAAATIYADRLAEVREPLWRTVLRGREGGLGRKHLVALMDLCIDDFHRGEWGEAAELAAEGLSVCEERGSRFFGWYFRYHQALLAAVQGRFDTSRALADQMIGWAGPRGVRTAQVYARHALVLADLGQGDFESAYHDATAMSPAGILASACPALPVGRHGSRGSRRADAPARRSGPACARHAGSGPGGAVPEAGHPGGGVRRHRRR